MRLVAAREVDTLQLGRRIGARLGAGDVVALSGALGAGKTVLARGFVEGAGGGGVVSSPTFTFIHAHRGMIPLYHVDLYRIENAHQLDDLGLEDIFAERAIVIVEWAERAGSYMPPEHLWITIAIDPATDERTIDLTPMGERYNRLLTSLIPAGT